MGEPNLPEELQKLYNYIDRGQIGSDLTRRIEQAVDKGRKSIGIAKDISFPADFDDNGWKHIRGDII